MKVYIAGKIGDLPVEEFTTKFQAAKSKLVELGYNAVIPLEFEHNHGRTWAEYMLEDLRELNQCDAICLLPCWKDSPGAKIEHQFARRAGKKVLHFRILTRRLSPEYTVRRGSDVSNSKLEECQIPVIRRMLAEGKTWQWIANQYHVSKGAIQRIASGKGWVHV